MRETITISMPNSLRSELDRATREAGVSRSDVIREALRDYLFLRRFRALSTKLRPYAEAQGVYTDEDVFKRVS